MPNEQIAFRIAELSRLLEGLEIDHQAHNVHQVRSATAELRTKSQLLKRLLDTDTKSSEGTDGPIWLIETTASELSEIAAAPEPEWDRIGAVLSFLESGIDQLASRLD